MIVTMLMTVTMMMKKSWVSTRGHSYLNEDGDDGTHPAEFKFKIPMSQKRPIKIPTEISKSL